MILKSFQLKKDLKDKSNFFLLYGENEGQKEEVINEYFLKEFKGETIKFEEKEILENKEIFFDACLNDSLFASEKIIHISRITSKIYEIIKDITSREITNKKIIFNSSLLDKKSKIRQLFEKQKNIICIAFYQDNDYFLFKIASDFFKKNKISISSENINLIVEKCAGDRKNLQNEMNKIFNFCFEKKKISREEITKLINLYEQENYFELIDSCLSKNHKQVCKIINNNSFGSTEVIILIRSFISRIKRLIELKKLYLKSGNISETINIFKPPIFWKDKEIVQKQVQLWSNNKIYELLDKVNFLEINLKKNPNFSKNLIFDLILETSNN